MPTAAIGASSAQTGLGAYTQERSVFVGAFQVNPSITSPARGGTITLNIVSSEGLDRSPTVTVTQPGFEPWTVTAKRISGKKYKVKITLKSGGGEGIVDFVVSGVDSKGGHQSSSLRLPLR